MQDQSTAAEAASSPDSPESAPSNLPGCIAPAASPPAPSSTEIVELEACAEQRYVRLQVRLELDAITPRAVLEGITPAGAVECIAVLSGDQVVDLQDALFSAELELAGDVQVVLTDKGYLALGERMPP